MEQASAEAGGNGGMVPPVAHRWRPGQSGNPAGKTPGTLSLTAHLRRILAEPGKTRATKGEELMAALVKAAKTKTGARHLALILDRIEGPVEHQVRHTGDVPAIVVRVVHDDEDEGDQGRPRDTGTASADSF